MSDDGNVLPKIPSTLVLTPEIVKFVPPAPTAMILLYVSVSTPASWYLKVIPLPNAASNLPFGAVTMDLPPAAALIFTTLIPFGSVYKS